MSPRSVAARNSLGRQPWDRRRDHDIESPNGRHPLTAAMSAPLGLKRVMAVHNPRADALGYCIPPPLGLSLQVDTSR